MQDETRQLQIDDVLNRVFVAWAKTSLTYPSDEARNLLTIGFAGNVKKRLGKTGRIAMLRNPPTWCGYVKHYGKSDLESTIVAESFNQCLANVTGKMLMWHRSGGYLGTVFNCQFQGDMLGKVESVDGYFDMVDTFCQLLLHLNGVGSTACRAWGKALGV